MTRENGEVVDGHFVWVESANTGVRPYKLVWLCLLRQVACQIGNSTIVRGMVVGAAW